MDAWNTSIVHVCCNSIPGILLTKQGAAPSESGMEEKTTMPNSKPLPALRWIFAAGILALVAGCAAPGSVPPRDRRSPVDDMNDTSRRAINSPNQPY